ncbi:MAG TPA: SRPBCC domain-containing protein, partial [Polyangia bacterium]|nr:SRPBCC domain-containing protein [Polyangia bacterium]
MIPARPERIYSAWMSSAEHTAFTGDKAVVDPLIGGVYSTFDGYSSGRTVDLQPGRRIVQTWRAEDFPVGSPDSRV